MKDLWFLLYSKDFSVYITLTISANNLDTDSYL